MSKYRNAKGPGSEHDGQEKLRKIMHDAGWHTEKMHGNKYQKDIPDLYCMHRVRGIRWVEMKKPQGKLSKGQIRKFIKWSKFGVKIWVLEGPQDYHKLMEPCNVAAYITKQQERY